MIRGVGGCIGTCLQVANMYAVGNGPQTVVLALELNGCAVGALDLATLLMEGDGAYGIAQGPCADKGFVHVWKDVCFGGLVGEAC